ncbi:hypothetical protein COCNU_11G011680 [Cocos nucifera]|uniref:Uncharacterized protein n=1 Tax=Cocos nucifera TaxID=13894 RepID=A0A8K0N9D9_COCNU|nr:hypothetical protein COCNU_11G011680 [Cocos nucifera]
MGGSQSSFCSCFSSPNEEAEGEPRYTSSKVRPSDEDRGRYVGEPDVDIKAAAFIDKFHKSRSRDPDDQKVECAV